jgi:hypothetical protein
MLAVTMNFEFQVYERASWTTLHMSRAQNARCNKKQEALDYQMAGTGLMLEMIENERLCKSKRKKKFSNIQHTTLRLKILVILFYVCILHIQYLSGCIMSQKI